MVDEVRGGVILKEVKEKLKSFQKDHAQKQVAIVRFNPPAKEKRPTQLAKYEAARFSTEHKVKTFEFLGCQLVQPILDFSIPPDEFVSLLKQLNEDPKTIGIIVQNPYSDRLTPALDQIDFEKDIDGMRRDNPLFRTSATSETIYRLVESFAQESDTVAVLGAKGFVGRGVVKLLKETGIDTIELDKGDDKSQVHQANIVVSATGDPELLDERHIIPEHRLVVDAGFIPGEGKPRGDVSRSAYNIPQHLTPVPGGVGPFQMATLLERLVSQVSEQQIEPWVYPGPEVERVVDPEMAEMVIDVAQYFLEKYGIEEADGSFQYIEDNYVFDRTRESLTITANDGRGVLFSVQEGKISSSLGTNDVGLFEDYAADLFPEQDQEIEEEIEDDGWEIE